MCFSATASYSAAVVLIASGSYALQQAWCIGSRYWLFALTPVMFGIQQGMEGRVWQLAGTGEAAVIPYALAFHLFSHFLWLWWIPLSCYRVEPLQWRRRLFLAVALFGALAGGAVYFTLLLHPDWLRVEVLHHHIVYSIAVPQQHRVRLGIPPSALYGLIILVPLLLSSHRHIRLFGVMIFLSIAVASLAYGYAFVSVWCFFAALLSLYLVQMVTRNGSAAGEAR